MDVTTPLARFTGSVALVTGAGHGIGRATALRLHAEGAAVVVADVDLAAAREVAAAGPERLHAVACDVTDRESVDAAVAATVERFGALDHLALVAGGAEPLPDLVDLPDEALARAFDLNLLGTVRCVRAAIPSLRASTRGPSVVMTSSVNGLAAFGDVAYSSAKAALPNLAANLATQLGPDGIRVNVVAPGTIRTRVWDAQPGRLEALRAIYPLGRVGEPEEVAAAIAFLCSADASFVTGVTLPVEGGVLAGPWQGLRSAAADYREGEG